MMCKVNTFAGNYLYINGALTLPKGSIAQIVSPTLSATSSGGACLRFWFFISGANTGTVNAYVQQVSSPEYCCTMNSLYSVWYIICLLDASVVLLVMLLFLKSSVYIILVFSNIGLYSYYC